ncbi:MAG: hypothetical protein KME22_28405 [Hassallia sp. WJT32-NPBG1]|jgi:hypothetical protein|nr:hypothetical protein [Hassallia sp. WJT32-NPBG1]
MDGNQRKYKGQVEINDLIGDAVKNAVFRRNEVIGSEDALSALSHEEAGNIAGGSAVTVAGGVISHPFPPHGSALA